MAANPAGVRTITEFLEHPGPGQPLTNGRTVTATLNSPGFINGGTREKVYTRSAVVDPVTGSYSLILEVNADIDPLNTSWTVKEPGNRLWTIQVPAGDPAVPLTLRSCLVADPTNPNPIVAGVSEAELAAFEAVVSSTYASLAGDPNFTGNPTIDEVPIAAILIVQNPDGTSDVTAGGGLTATQTGDGQAQLDLDGTTVTIGPGPAGADGVVLAITSPDNSITVGGTASNPTLEVASAGGAVSTVFGRTGTVTAQTGDYTAAQVGADASGAAAAAQSASQPLDSDLTAIAALSTTTYGRSLLTQANAAAALATIGADASGAASAAQAAAILASLQRASNLSDLSSAATARTNLGLGSASTHASTDFDASGAAATAQAAAIAVSAGIYPAASKSGYYYYFYSGQSNGTSASANNNPRVGAFWTDVPLTISQLFCEFTTAGDAASVFHPGIWLDDGFGWPNTVALDAPTLSTGTGNAGAVATAGTPGIYAIPLASNFTFVPHTLYWVGGASQGVTSVTPVYRSVAATVMPAIRGPLGTSLPATNQTLSAWQGVSMAGALTAFGSPSSTAAMARLGYKVA